ncbi:MAG TPA: hypothetical protein VIJ62_04745 [Rhizomicrobium sp.]
MREFTRLVAATATTAKVANRLILERTENGTDHFQQDRVLSKK